VIAAFLRFGAMRPHHDVKRHHVRHSRIHAH
jgi:hypothetical protein